MNSFKAKFLTHQMKPHRSLQSLVRFDKYFLKIVVFCFIIFSVYWFFKNKKTPLLLRRTYSSSRCSTFCSYIIDKQKQSPRYIEGLLELYKYLLLRIDIIGVWCATSILVSLVQSIFNISSVSKSVRLLRIPVQIDVHYQ